MRHIRSLCVVAAATLVAGSLAVANDAFTIVDAINQAVTTHPGVGEAAANRRATEAEMRQVQGTLLPQVRLEAKVGRHRFNQQDVVPPPTNNNSWLRTHETSIAVRQILFDGLTSINEIWRQAARVDAAAYRVRERTELIALDAAEAYIDVVRFTHLVGLANENIAAHRRILANVEARFQGGRAGEGDLEQVRERVEAAIAVRAQFVQQLDEARAVYRRVVGIEPYNLRIPGRLRGLPASKDSSLAITLRHNPTIQAGEADRLAARHGFNATTGSFLPNVAFEGRATRGRNIGTVAGDQTEASALVVASWDIFRGGQNAWRRAEFAERYEEQTMRHARLQREAFELIDKAWAARTITNDRIAALTRQIAADRRVIEAYTKEYELGQRSLIDLLNAYNQLFNARVSLESTRGTAVFADYQLLAAMGQLTAYLKQPTSVDAEPLQTVPLGILPMKLPPVLIKLPEPGPEPLNISASGAPVRDGVAARGGLRIYAAAPHQAGPAPDAVQEGSFTRRWPAEQSFSWFEAFFRRAPAEQRPAAPEPAPTAATHPTPGPLDLGPNTSAFAPETRSQPAWLSTVRIN
ncbi:MAG: TolC family outer membrane protein [Xanthobacteraceae bacterium]|nr:TolC family outer membrane protein [Xanthobacteraceae bacterium]